jgi:hypothetical protein
VSVTIHGQHRGNAIVEDDNGEGSIPLRHIHVLSHNASTRDAGFAAYGGRRFDRDLLLRLRVDLETNALADIDDCAYEDAYRSCEAPAIDGRYCPQHATED